MAFSLIFFCSPVDAVQPRRRKNGGLHAVNRVQQPATTIFTEISLRLALFCAKGHILQALSSYLLTGKKIKQFKV